MFAVYDTSWKENITCYSMMRMASYTVTYTVPTGNITRCSGWLCTLRCTLFQLGSFTHCILLLRMASYTVRYIVSTQEHFMLQHVVRDGLIHCQVHRFNLGTLHVAACWEWLHTRPGTLFQLGKFTCCWGWLHTLSGTLFQIRNISCYSMWQGMAFYTIRYSWSNSTKSVILNDKLHHESHKTHSLPNSVTW
jgi:hypothetical protein